MKQSKKSFVNYVLELITDPFLKANTDAVDRCLRLNGELMPVPQTKDEEALFDKTLWDYMNKRLENSDIAIMKRKTHVYAAADCLNVFER